VGSIYKNHYRIILFLSRSIDDIERLELILRGLLKGYEIKSVKISRSYVYLDVCSAKELDIEGLKRASERAFGLTLWQGRDTIRKSIKIEGKSLIKE